MAASNDARVQVFLDEMLVFDAPKHEIMQHLREIVFDAAPKAVERMMYGGIMFSLEDDFGGIFAYKKHVSFEFSQGAVMEDPNQVLEGSGKFRRHLKIASFADIQHKKTGNFVHQAIALI